MKKIIICITVLATVSILFSCKDFLLEEPLFSQSNEMTLGSYEGLDNATAALYARFQNSPWYGAAFILSSDLRCGNAKNPNSQPGSGRYRVDPFWNYNENTTSGLWSYAYYTISWCNNVINNLEGKESVDVTAQQLNNLKAEALFVRALCHFDLVITYAQPYTYQPDGLGVPVVLVTENALPARNTIREVYTQVVEDLLEAESIISDNYSRPNANDPFAVTSKSAIQALLSRVYLYMGEWQNCANYATKVINSGLFSLADPETYLSMWTSTIAARGGEVIFEMYGSTRNSYWDESGWESISYITNFEPNGSADVCASLDLMALYEEGDVRTELFDLLEDDYFTKKYAGKTGSPIPKENNVILLRLSEMYLNRAEALYNGATISGATAQSDLDALAAKRGFTPVSPSATTIFTERRKELAFEGHIFFDYARTKTPLVRNDYSGLTNKDIPFPSNQWAMPIPKRETDANPNMEQNPGY